MSKTCVVTGGAGFIGCALSTKLANRFDRVVVIDSLHPQIHAERKRPADLDPRVELVVADVTEASTWVPALETIRPEVVVHLAAETGTGQSLTEASRHAIANVLGTTRMLDAFATASHVPERFVLASSRAVYGEGAWRSRKAGEITYPGQRSKQQLERAEWDFPGLEPLPMDAEKTIPNPTSIYGATKLTQEQILRAWALSFGTAVNVLRLQNVYGPGQSLTNSYTGIVSLFIRMAKEGKSIPIYEDGDIGRDFVFIDDVASALDKATATDLSQSLAYDVGTGSKTTVLDLARIVAKRYEAPEPHVNGMFRNGDVRCAVANIDRTVRELEWRPLKSVDEGIGQLSEWVDSQLG
ncbi:MULTISPECIES: NAD-dependent epimerase/dehydratase family protein [Mesorhizobium]|uniref:NAD-dependent dehydratase n=5 Tax=Mesorhizobium TaxID=68287 RepID=A0A1A5IDN3_RHILI|nr:MULTISPECIES: NAD-dependent epimerase/dehydratase family protein [Mesorhizobium]ETA71977.1 nucleoside-diphosphate-sugar epimerase [Mesorhizobium japonicum R7A]MBE1708816.1 NAD-dependent epimerase/dehydratase family protein [Mesorhizobium japonicum]MBE1713985.1 NAD-dependent epimerase/dehydratase family protein [Mesorhizobium japonicum]MUT20136.1 NAD-dependent epimerase/dehydratase family protein [Mesorhizobium japonicum]MUT26106.1 NAD-dependent epimerase/dehydratase family protein [Mesorhiz